jgi:hypothetical protein
MEIDSLKDRIIPIPIIDDIFWPVELFILFKLLGMKNQLFAIPQIIIWRIPVIGPILNTAIATALILFDMTVLFLYTIIFMIIW